MKLNKTVQYALLLTLYLGRSGRNTIKNVAESLKLNEEFLQQVASKLRKFGVLESKRGPGGGYEVKDAATVADVLNAIEPVKVLSDKELAAYKTSTAQEKRVLAYTADLFTSGLSLVLRRTIKNVAAECVLREVNAMNKLGVSKPLAGRFN